MEEQVSEKEEMVSLTWAKRQVSGKGDGASNA